MLSLPYLFVAAEPTDTVTVLFDTHIYDAYLK